jgi:hypothetical protein
VQGYGNIKLRGKKFKLLRCGCCEAFNCKHEKAVGLMQHEIQEYKTTHSSQESPNEYYRMLLENREKLRTIAFETVSFQKMESPKGTIFKMHPESERKQFEFDSQFDSGVLSDD